MADALMPAISPMLAVSGGRLILLSSPFGKRGTFFREWTEGGTAWERYTVRAEDCPRIPAAYLLEERRKLGTFYPQEFECEFLDTTNALFSGSDIDRAFDNDLAPAFDLSLLEEPL